MLRRFGIDKKKNMLMSLWSLTSSLSSFANRIFSRFYYCHFWWWRQQQRRHLLDCPFVFSWLNWNCAHDARALSFLTNRIGWKQKSVLAEVTKKKNENKIIRLMSSCPEFKKLLSSFVDTFWWIFTQYLFVFRRFHIRSLFSFFVLGAHKISIFSVWSFRSADNFFVNDMIWCRFTSKWITFRPIYENFDFLRSRRKYHFIFISSCDGQRSDELLFAHH